MQLLQKDSCGNHSPTGAELGYLIYDVILSSQNMQVLEAVEIILQLVKLLAIHHHVIIQT
jgi:hypothetical protein